MEPREHPFSWEALRRIVIVGLVILIAWRLGEIFADIVIAMVFAAALYPIVQKLHKKLPFMLSILIVLFSFIIPLAVLAYFAIPAFVHGFPDFLTSINSTISHLSFAPASWKDFNLIQYLQANSNFVFYSTENAFLSIISAITVSILTFYFVLDFERLFDLFIDLIPHSERTKVRHMLKEVARVTGQYIRGNVIISLICGSILFIGLVVIGVPYAFPLAIFAATLDLLPLVGGTIGAIPALIIAFGISPTTGILVLVLHLAYQEAENAIISPAIYNKALNLSPALSFLSVIIGGALFGIVGAFLALPVAASLPVIVRYREDYEKRNE